MIKACIILLAVLLSACGNSENDTMGAQRKWCHDRGGYIANTGWYEWKCIINGTPIYMPSPQDKQ